MNILIIEDEPLVAKKLHRLVMELEPSAAIPAVTASIAATVQWLRNNPHPELMLMDIELADGQSFDIFKQVEIKTPVIFTTAYDEFALKAFKVNSIDYLLKPVKTDELRMALNKYHDMVADATRLHERKDYHKLLTVLKELPVTRNYKDRFLVRQGQKSFSITSTDIAFFFTDNSVSYLYTKDRRKFIIDYTLDEVEQSTDPVLFFRANRQSIVASSSVVAVHPWFNGKLKIEIKPEHEDHLVISREKAGEFRQWLGA